MIKDVAKRAAAKQTKWFPFVGQAVSASISYYFMSKLGKDHINKCEKVINNLCSVIIVSRCKIYMLKTILNELNLAIGFGKVKL